MGALALETRNGLWRFHLRSTGRQGAGQQGCAVCWRTVILSVGSPGSREESIHLREREGERESAILSQDSWGIGGHSLVTAAATVGQNFDQLCSVV